MDQRTFLMLSSVRRGGYMRKMRIYIAVVLAMVIGGSGCFSFANMSKAAEAVGVSEAAGLASGAETEESAADESGLPAQVEQNNKNGTGEAENEEKVSSDTGDSNGEQQESQESLEGTEDADSADVSENGIAAKPDDNTGTDSSRDSAEQGGSSETDGGEAPEQSGGSGTDAGDVSSGDNVDGSSSAPSSGKDNNAATDGSAEAPEQSEGSASSEGESGKDSSSASESREKAKAAGLDIPQEIGLIIDPWEIDGRGQVYSEQYVIKNNGENTIKLHLYGLTCTPGEQSGAAVCADREGMHDSDGKAIYMEMVFGNGDRVAFTEEEAEYTAELEPEGELVLWFAGEVNADVSQDWNENDIKVTILYQWDDGQQGQAEDAGISGMEYFEGEAIPGTEPTEGAGINGADGDLDESSVPISDKAEEGSISSGDDSKISNSGSAEGSEPPENKPAEENVGMPDDKAEEGVAAPS